MIVIEQPMLILAVKDALVFYLLNFLYSADGQRTDPFDVEQILEQIMSDEFSTILEDDSAYQVGCYSSHLLLIGRCFYPLLKHWFLISFFL